MLTSLLVYYILVAGFNLIFKLAVPNRPTCQPMFCKEIISESAFCLIKTPGFPDCVNIEGYFYVLSAPLAYSLLAITFALSYYFSRRFYLTRIFLVLLVLVLILIIIRLALGSFELSAKGAFQEFNKSGLNQLFIQQLGNILFKMFNPKL